MKLNFESIFRFKPEKIECSVNDDENTEYDKHADFYLTNLINSLVLFALNRDDLEKLIEPTFDPMFELESEIDYAFTPVCFETIFRNRLIDERFKQELKDFKKETDDIPNEIWDWEYLDNNEQWISIRKKANELLDKLGIKHRKYNEDYVTVYNNGNITKKGKKL